jgi:hypothetical protein
MRLMLHQLFLFYKLSVVDFKNQLGAHVKADNFGINVGAGRYPNL